MKAINLKPGVVLRPAAVRPRLLDLFCGAGGAAMGYHRAGFDVLGVDIKPQPNYPFPFVRHDALTVVDAFGGFDAIHASPPCQAYTKAHKIRRNTHPDLVPPTRALLDQTGIPYVIENVEGAPLIDPVVLCGSMFGLGTYRHRLFEANWPLTQPGHPEHRVPLTKMGRYPSPDRMMHVVGNFAGVSYARAAMGIGWMTRDELSESIPPAYAPELPHLCTFGVGHRIDHRCQCGSEATR